MSELKSVAPHNSHRLHGTYVKYVVDLCRCDECRRANRDYVRANERRKAIEKFHPERSKWVDAEPARKHVRSLMASGLGQHDGVGLKQIVKVSGVSQGVLWKLVYGKRRPNGEQIPSQTILRTTADKLLALTRQHMAGGASLDRVTTKRVWQMVEELIAWYNAEIGTVSGNGTGAERKPHPYGGKAWLGRQLTGNPTAASLQLSKTSISVHHARIVAELHDKTHKESEAFRWRYCSHGAERVEAPESTTIPASHIAPHLDTIDLVGLERRSGIPRRTLHRIKSGVQPSVTLALADRLALALGLHISDFRGEDVA